MGRFLSCLAAVALLLAADSGAQDKSKKGKYGKVLVAEYRLPAETIAKIATFKPSAPGPGENKIEAVLLANTEEWYGPPIDVKYASNPYTLVVTLTGTARADGDALTMWQAGWRLDGSERRYTVLPGLSKLGAKAGERFTATAAATPSRFKDDRSNIAVALAFVRSSNVDVQSVEMQLWSGIASASWLETLGAFSYLLVAVILVALVWFWRRRRE
jgi:hypothetical protein